jgi:hypothetical protein
VHINELLGEPVTVDFKGMAITFKPSAYTFIDQEALVSLAENDPSSWQRLRDMLARVLVSWEFEDDQGPIPPTSEGIKRLPLALVAPIMEALGEVMTPSEDEKKGLSEGSRIYPSASSKPPSTSQGGTTSSIPPDTSASLPGNSPVSQSAG